MGGVQVNTTDCLAVVLAWVPSLALPPHVESAGRHSHGVGKEFRPAARSGPLEPTALTAAL